MKRVALVLALVTLACSDPSPSGPIHLTPDQTLFALPSGGFVQVGFTIRNDADAALTWLSCPHSAWLERRDGRVWTPLRLFTLDCIQNPPTIQIDPGATAHDVIGLGDSDGPGLYRIHAEVGLPDDGPSVEGISAPFTVDRAETATH